MIGADLIANSLKKMNVEYIFEYPGGTTVFILDSIRRLTDIKIITCRNEQAASFAACGYSKSTGKTGVCMSTSGPGASNLITGIADAYFDHIPLVAITGQVPISLYQKSGDRQTGFQEIDIVQICEPITVYGKTIISDFYTEIKTAFHLASIIKGPALLDIPIDLQRSEV